MISISLRQTAVKSVLRQFRNWNFVFETKTWSFLKIGLSVTKICNRHFFFMEVHDRLHVRARRPRPRPLRPIKLVPRILTWPFWVYRSEFFELFVIRYIFEMQAIPAIQISYLWRITQRTPPSIPRYVMWVYSVNGPRVDSSLGWLFFQSAAAVHVPDIMPSP